jgi:hypothetical protein
MSAPPASRACADDLLPTEIVVDGGWSHNALPAALQPGQQL